MFNLTLEDLKTLLSKDESKSHSFVVGKSYLVRTVTMHYTGKLVAVTDSDIVLYDAAWVADTGRYSEALAKGTLSEVEVYPNEVCVSRGCIVDFAEWNHHLPREAK